MHSSSGIRSPSPQVTGVWLTKFYQPKKRNKLKWGRDENWTILTTRVTKITFGRKIVDEDDVKEVDDEDLNHFSQVVEEGNNETVQRKYQKGFGYGKRRSRCTYGWHHVAVAKVLTSLLGEIFRSFKNTAATDWGGYLNVVGHRMFFSSSFVRPNSAPKIVHPARLIFSKRNYCDTTAPENTCRSRHGKHATDNKETLDNINLDTIVEIT